MKIYKRLFSEKTINYKVRNATAFDKELEKFVKKLGAKKLTNANLGDVVSFTLDSSKEGDVIDFLNKIDKNKNAYITDDIGNLLYDPSRG